MDVAPIPIDWLGERISVQIAEEDNTKDGIPFSGRHDEWEALKAKMIEGDEIGFLVAKVAEIKRQG